MYRYTKREHKHKYVQIALALLHSHQNIYLCGDGVVMLANNHRLLIQRVQYDSLIIRKSLC